MWSPYIVLLSGGNHKGGQSLEVTDKLCSYCYLIWSHDSVTWIVTKKHLPNTYKCLETLAMQFLMLVTTPCSITMTATFHLKSIGVLAEREKWLPFLQTNSALCCRNLLINIVTCWWFLAKVNLEAVSYFCWLSVVVGLVRRGFLWVWLLLPLLLCEVEVCRCFVGFLPPNTEENAKRSATTGRANKAEAKNQMSSLVAHCAKTSCFPKVSFTESWRCSW